MENPGTLKRSPWGLEQSWRITPVQVTSHLKVRQVSLHLKFETFRERETTRDVDMFTSQGFPTAFHFFSRIFFTSSKAFPIVPLLICTWLKSWTWGDWGDWEAWDCLDFARPVSLRSAVAWSHRRSTTAIMNSQSAAQSALVQSHLDVWRLEWLEIKCVKCLTPGIQTTSAIHFCGEDCAKFVPESRPVAEMPIPSERCGTYHRFASDQNLWAVVHARSSTSPAFCFDHFDSFRFISCENPRLFDSFHAVLHHFSHLFTLFVQSAKAKSATQFVPLVTLEQEATNVSLPGDGDAKHSKMGIESNRNGVWIFLLTLELQVSAVKSLWRLLLLSNDWI